MKTISEMTPDEMAQAIRQLHCMIRNLGNRIRVDDRNDFVRASHMAICSRCGLELIDHPGIANNTLHIDCGGQLYRL